MEQRGVLHQDTFFQALYITIFGKHSPTPWSWCHQGMVIKKKTYLKKKALNSLLQPSDLICLDLIFGRWLGTSSDSETASIFSSRLCVAKDALQIGDAYFEKRRIHGGMTKMIASFPTSKCIMMSLKYAKLQEYRRNVLKPAAYLTPT